MKQTSVSTPDCTTSTQHDRHDPTGTWYLTTGTWVLLTLAMTYPQVTQLSTHVGQHYDALFGTWRLAWIAHQLPRDPAHLFDANIFFPEPNTLAYSDAMLLPAMLVAPLLWLGVPAITAYNLLVIAAFASAGIAAYVLARSLGVPPIAAWFAGVVFAFNPYRFAHYPQLELLWTCWIPLALWALHRAITTQRVKDGALVGLFVALQALSCVYYALFLVLALCIVAPLDAFRSIRGRAMEMWKPAAAAVLTAAVIVVPYAWAYVGSSAVVGLRTIAEVRHWSPPLRSYAIAQYGNLLYPSPPHGIDRFEQVLFPGITSVLAALCGVVFALHRRAIVYAVLLVIAFDLSLGTNGLIYPFLYEWVRPFRGLRVPARMFVLVSIALAVLGAVAIARLTTLRWGGAVALALTVAVLVETASLPLALEEVPDPPRLYRWLAQQPVGPVVEWPTPVARGLGFTRDPYYMYYSTAHWFPLVNGYSGNYPASYIRFLDAFETFPHAEAIDVLLARGVRYLILHSQPDHERYVAVVQQLTGQPRLRFQFAENVGSEEIAVYVVAP